MKSLLQVSLLAVLFTLGCGGGSLATPAPITPVTQPPPPPPPPPPPDPSPSPAPTPPPSTPPPLPANWTATDLVPLDGFTAAQANAVNDAGYAVGYSTASEMFAAPTLWKDGHVIDIGDGQNSFANGINNLDQIVGYVSHPDLTARAMLWPGSVDLGLLDGFDSSVASGINDSGVIVGTAFNTNAPDEQQGFMWTQAAGMQPIPGCVDALAINNAGQVVGISTALNATICGSADFGLSGAAVAINSLGVAVGFANNPLRAEQWPSTDVAANSVATGINDNGWIVGYQFTSVVAAVRHAIVPGLRTLKPCIVVGTTQSWVWSQQTGVVVLPILVTASAINQSGQVVGAGIASNGSTHGVLLTGN